MEMIITSDSENKLMERREISLTVDHEKGTPKKEELVKELCKKLSLSPESTIIVKIGQAYGTKQSSALAYSYKSKEILEKREPKHLLARIAKRAAKGAKAQEKKE